MREVIERGAVAIERYWFSPIPQRAIALSRIVFGLSIFFAYAELIPSFGMMFGASGIGGSEFRAHVTPPHGIARAMFTTWTWLANVTSDGLLVALYGLMLIAALAFALGLFTRASGITAVALHVLFQARFEFAFWGWATLLPPLALYVILSPASRFASLDAAIRARAPIEPSPAFPLRLLQIHCVCLYLTVASARLNTPYWLDGTALYRILADRTFSRVPDVFLETRWPLAVLGSGALLLEWTGVLLLFRRKLARAVALGLVAMHVGLELLTMVGWWNAVLVAVLLTFVDPKTGGRGSPSEEPRATEPAGTRDSAAVRALKLTCLTAYAVLLFVASFSWVPWPRQMRVLARASHGAASFLQRGGIVSGLALFYDPTDSPILRRGNCVVLRGERVDGSHVTEELTPDGCARRATPLELPKPATAIINILYDAYAVRQDRFIREFPARGPTHVAAIAEYYCHGAHPVPPLRTLRITWAQDFRHIRTGREARGTVMDAEWSCDDHHFTSMVWERRLDRPDIDLASSPERDDVTP